MTVPEFFLLPRMQEIVDEVGRMTFVSKFDLLKGYYFVKLTKRAQEPASFITPMGLVSYKIMAFGLKNASAPFQRMINHVIARVIEILAYINDIVVFSSPWEEHMQLREELFRRLEVAYLTVNLTKSEFVRARQIF